MSRAMAIIAPGMFLSHAATTTRPSMLSPKVTVSMESAMTSRLTRDAFMPSVPIEMPSLIVIVPNRKGTLFAALSPSLTLRACLSRWTLQGVTSDARFATATKGLFMSSSSSPVARSMALAAARSGPSVTTLLFFFRFNLASIVMPVPPACFRLAKLYQQAGQGRKNVLGLWR